VDVVLIPGLWLDGSAWDEVVPALDARGHRPVPLTLPGQGDGAFATLDDQVAAVVAAIDDADQPVLVVGHSAACSLAWAAADARPDQVAAVAMIGGFPVGDGETYADFFEPVDGLGHFPGWEPFDGPDSDDLDDASRAAFETRTVTVPAEVTRGIVRLTDERRFQVPVVLVCPEYTPSDARQWLEGGQIPELASVNTVTMVDIDSGHWPMFTRPVALAELIATIANDAWNAGGAIETPADGPERLA
jgi:pimeloyl-ACP methyl ester carboxylesterase